MSVLLASALAVAAVDGLTKYLATIYLVESRLYGVGGAWGLRRVHNRRGALAGLPVRYTVVVWVLAVVTAGSVAGVMPGRLPVSLGLGIAIGGAAGNILDRALRGYVVDFVAAGPWPVFNVADAAMVIGLLLAAVSVLA